MEECGLWATCTCGDGVDHVHVRATCGGRTGDVRMWRCEGVEECEEWTIWATCGGGVKECRTVVSTLLCGKKMHYLRKRSARSALG